MDKAERQTLLQRALQYFKDMRCGKDSMLCPVVHGNCISRSNCGKPLDGANIFTSDDMRILIEVSDYLVYECGDCDLFAAHERDSAITVKKDMCVTYVCCKNL